MITDYRTLKSGVAATALVIAGATGSTAATLDFTDPSAYDLQTSSGASGTISTLDGASVNWFLSSADGDLTYTDYDGPAGATPLAEGNDGVGVDDDEVSYIDGNSELLELTFTSAVELTGFHFLDLYAHPDIDEAEQALVYADAAPTGTPSFTFTGTEDFQENGGYRFGEGTVTGSTFVFASSMFNDGKKFPDYALAGVDYNPDSLTSPGGGMAPIPLPAGALLLGTGLAAFGVVRRRKA